MTRKAMNNKPTTNERLNNLETRMNALDSKLDAILAALEPPKPVKKTSGKPAKDKPTTKKSVGKPADKHGKKANEPQYTPIVFTQEGRSVKADKYMVHALYVTNRELVEELGGTIITGKVFTAQFKSVAKAKDFVKQAVCEISTADYVASKSKPQTKKSAGTKWTSAENKALAAELRAKLGRQFTPEEWENAKANACK